MVLRGSLLGRRSRRQVGPGPELRARATSPHAVKRALYNSPKAVDRRGVGHPGEGRHQWSSSLGGGRIAKSGARVEDVGDDATERARPPTSSQLEGTKDMGAHSPSSLSSPSQVL
jgi:hypothetical protein